MQTLALFSEQIGLRNADIVKEKLGGVLRLLPDFLQRLAFLEPLSIGFDDDKGKTARSIILVGFQRDDCEVSDIAIGDEGLGTIDDIVALHAAGLGRNGAQV